MRRSNALLLGVAATLVSTGAPARASDHNEPQSINALGLDPLSPSDDSYSDAADIYGNYAFPTDDSVVVVLTFPAPPFGFEYLPTDAEPAGPWDESLPNAYDDGVLYAWHVDRDLGAPVGANVADAELEIFARFGYDPETRRWGVRVEGIPGEDGPLEAPVGTTIEGSGGARVIAGLFDEPFFVDLERFFEGLVVPNRDDVSSARLDFRSDIDFFAGYNVHAIIVEVPKENVATALRRHVSVWSSTHRLPSDPGIRPGNDCAR